MKGEQHTIIVTVPKKAVIPNEKKQNKTENNRGQLLFLNHSYHV